MEGGWSWEQKTLISELIQGMNMAKQLKAHLSATGSVEGNDLLVQKILSSYEKALLILNMGGGSKLQNQTQNLGIAAATVSCGVPESPLSINGSPKSDEFEGGFKDSLDNQASSKKRFGF